MKILVVEDDYITSKVLREILSEYGDADSAENGLVALDYLKRALDAGDPYDVIFLDIMMPELDGQTTLKELRAMEEERGILGLDATKVIMLTALDDFENVKTSFVSQCEGYVVKPFDKEKIKKAMIDAGVLKET